MLSSESATTPVPARSRPRRRCCRRNRHGLACLGRARSPVRSASIGCAAVQHPESRSHEGSAPPEDAEATAADVAGSDLVDVGDDSAEDQRKLRDSVMDAVRDAPKSAARAAQSGARRVGDAGSTAIGTAADAASSSAKAVASSARGVAGGVSGAASVVSGSAVSSARVAAGGVSGAASSSAKAVVSSARVAADGVRATGGAVKRHSVQAATVVQGLLVGSVASQINQFVAGAVAGGATVYDKAMDANYLNPLLRPDLGGSYHRLFDGGHTLYGAAQAARVAAPDDTLIEQTAGTVQALLRDASTPRGLPVATWEKSTFDTVAGRLEATVGIPKRWLYELNTFDVADMLGASVGVLAVAFNWRRADTEEFSRLTAGMGLSAAATLNPLLLLVSLVSAAQAFNKAKISGEYANLADGAFRGAATSAASLGAVALVTAAGGAAGAGLLVGLTVGVLAHQVAKRVSVTEIAGVVADHADALAERLTVWAKQVLDRDDSVSDPADVVMAREILALPRVSVATAASAPILEAVARATAEQEQGAFVSTSPLLELPLAAEIPLLPPADAPTTSEARP